MIYLIKFIEILFQTYTFMIFGRIIASWFPPLYEYKFMQFIIYYTDPYLNVFRRFIPPLGMIDFSPIVAFISLGIIQNILIQLIVGVAS